MRLNPTIISLFLFACATTAAASPPNSPRNPGSDDRWMLAGTLKPDNAPLYINKTETYSVGDKEAGSPVHTVLWVIYKNPQDGPKGKYTEVREELYVVCDTKQIMNDFRVEYYDINGVDLGSYQRKDTEHEYSPILLGTGGNGAYNYACPK